MTTAILEEAQEIADAASTPPFLYELGPKVPARCWAPSDTERSCTMSHELPTAVLVHGAFAESAS